MSIFTYAIPYGYEFKKDITINSLLVAGTEDLIDFPVLLTFTDLDLRSIGHGGKVYSAAGHDIVFTLDNCAIDLNHQLESYDPSTGTISVWVRIPILYANTNTLFSMYYGNDEVLSSTSSVSTWNSTYESVLHLHENPSGSIPQMIDASGKGHSGTAQGGMNASNQVAGISNLGLSFDEVNDYVFIPDFDYASTKSFSVSLWFRLNDNSGNSYQYLFSHGAYGTFNSMNVYFGENALAITPDQNMLKTIFQDANDATSTNGLDAGNTYHDGQWHYYVFTVNELGNPTVYLDGIPQANISFNGGQSYDPITNIFLGARSDLNANRYWGGELDEFRLMNDTISQFWIQTEYNNVVQQGSFFSIGTETSPAIGCAPLAVGNISLTARKDDHSSGINLWVLLPEISTVEQFSIERSTSLQNWETVEKVIIKNYELDEWTILDSNPERGMNYYRVVVSRKDQTIEYSEIKPVYIIADYALHYYPNPVQEMLTIDFTSSTQGTCELSLIGMTGVSFYNHSVFLPKGVSRLELPMGSIASGVYYLQVVGPEGVTRSYLVSKL
jgi:hypothetical protein